MKEAGSPLTNVTNTPSVQLESKPRANPKSSSRQRNFNPLAPVMKVFNVLCKFMGSMFSSTGKFVGHMTGFFGKYFMAVWHSVRWIFTGIGRPFAWMWNRVCHGFAYLFHGIGYVFHSIAHFFESISLFQSPSAAPTMKPTAATTSHRKHAYGKVHTKTRYPTSSPTVHPTDAVPPPPPPPAPVEDAAVTPPPAGSPIFSPQVAI
eukprot:CAMPEP_0170191258 /NCGR_PEP_ID=MMETSP0040_2-20121228/51307_1 /TAXON_ID=641309 /ORGANISM="Lotharella oceanica, Strain CCMP622" /LENGTH=204 /DNA_ID=CAMNT_0010439305 /DNA_START=246 /DNA_END=860 /DNA_ORIENTATION=-